MDAFFASVEQVINPSLLGKPIAVCGAIEGRSIITTSSYAARARGVKTGMPIYLARKACPSIILVEGDHRKYLYYSMQIMNILKRFSDRVEAYSIDEAFLDLKGICKDLEEAKSLGYKIKKTIRQELKLPCTVGISQAKIVAKVATSLGKPDGLFVIPKNELDRHYWTLPVKELVGIGQSTEVALKIMNINTIGDLANAPVTDLIRRFGKNGYWMKQIALGNDPSEVVHDGLQPPPKSISHSTTLDQDIKDRGRLRAVLSYLVSKVAQRMWVHGASYRTIYLVVRDSSFKTVSIARTYDGHDRGEALLFLRSASILDGWINDNPATKVRLIGIGISGFNYGAYQMELPLSRQARQDLAVTDIVTRVRRRFGQNSILRANALV
ncbi:MAG: DNA polymerase IV [Candidatus Coatesbacteria bacterium]|nr:DNA polymerase IV [Candidatus Coatesbacteria bacterium]